jgi:maleate cis-trans isomerase
MKKVVLFLALVSHLSLFAGFLDDLIGKDKAYLEANGFKCTEFSCVTKDQNYFNIKLLDNAIEYVKFTARIKMKCTA